MRKRIHKILVTGGAGFIGSEFVRQAVKKGYKVIIVDKLTYAGDLERLKSVSKNFIFYKADICDKAVLASVFRKEKPSIVVNFAAETHVDRSIKDAAPFMKTNVVGTQVLLDVSGEYEIKKLIHISTDEIYGEIKKGCFSEESPLRPNSPYAASKAAGDMLVKSYVRTYNSPAIIVRPCNCYGPWQYPEKLIPLAMLKVFKKQKIPVYADGRNVREWLYVEDCARGILEILRRGKTGEAYNLGSGQERRNIDVVKKLLRLFGVSDDAIQFVKDRPGHDFRYKLNSNKTMRQIRWRPRISFDEGMRLTARWGRLHTRWLLKKWQDMPPA